MPPRQADKNALALNSCCRTETSAFTHSQLAPAAFHRLPPLRSELIVVKWKPVRFGWRFRPCFLFLHRQEFVSRPVCRETVQTFIQVLPLKRLGTWKRRPTSSFSPALCSAPAAVIPLTSDEDFLPRPASHESQHDASRSAYEHHILSHSLDLAWAKDSSLIDVKACVKCILPVFIRLNQINRMPD